MELQLVNEELDSQNQQLKVEHQEQLDRVAREVKERDQERDIVYEEYDELINDLECYEQEIQQLQSYIKDLEADRIQLINELETAEEQIKLLSKNKKRERENQPPGQVVEAKRVKVTPEDVIRRSSCVFSKAKKPLCESSPYFGANAEE